MYVQQVRRPETGKVIRQLALLSILALVLWAVVGVAAWAVSAATSDQPPDASKLVTGGTGSLQSVAPPDAPAAGQTAIPPGGGDPAPPAAGRAAAGRTEQAAGHYQDQAFGFGLDHPEQWVATALPPGAAPGSELGLPGTPVPGSVGGVEFPYSSHIDLSLIVQDTTAAGVAGWGATPDEILARMAESQGLAVAAGEGASVHEVTKSGLEAWGLRYAPLYATEHMWVVVSSGHYNYLFFLTVGGAADDRGTVQQMFDEVIPSFTVDS
jgi:hypothetical protein